MGGGAGVLVGGVEDLLEGREEWRIETGDTTEVHDYNL